MHPDTTGGSKISADWPGALGRVLAGYHGTNHFTLVANGTCGNLNHLDCLLEMAAERRPSSRTASPPSWARPFPGLQAP